MLEPPVVAISSNGDHGSIRSDAVGHDVINLFGQPVAQEDYFLYRNENHHSGDNESSFKETREQPERDDQRRCTRRWVTNAEIEHTRHSEYDCPNAADGEPETDERERCDLVRQDNTASEEVVGQKASNNAERVTP